jgi:hypothetical protein
MEAFEELGLTATNPEGSYFILLVRAHPISLIAIVNLFF